MYKLYHKILSASNGRQIPLLIGIFDLEAFSPAVEKEFSSAKFLVDLQVLYAKRRYTRQSFSARGTCIIVFQPRG